MQSVVESVLALCRAALRSQQHDASGETNWLWNPADLIGGDVVGNADNMISSRRQHLHISVVQRQHLDSFVYITNQQE